MVKQTFTPPEAALFLGINQSSLDQYRSRGTGPEYMKINDWRIQYTREALQEWQRVKSQHKGPGRKRTKF
jgi:hypothetical protein